MSEEKELSEPLAKLDAFIKKQEEKIYSLSRQVESLQDESARFEEESITEYNRANHLESELDDLKEKLSESNFNSDNVIDDMKVTILQRLFKNCTIDQLEIIEASVKASIPNYLDY